MKMAAGRGKDEQDLEFVICDSGANWKQIKSVIKEHLGVYAAEEIDSVRAVAQWKRKTGK